MAVQGESETPTWAGWRSRQVVRMISQPAGGPTHARSSRVARATGSSCSEAQQAAELHAGDLAPGQVRAREVLGQPGRAGEAECGGRAVVDRVDEAVQR